MVEDPSKLSFSQLTGDQRDEYGSGRVMDGGRSEAGAMCDPTRSRSCRRSAQPIIVLELRALHRDFRLFFYNGK